MTPPKKWPQRCEDARMDCIALSRESHEYVERLMEMVHGDDVLRLLHKVSMNCLLIQNKLNEVKGKELVQEINDYLDEQLQERRENE